MASAIDQFGRKPAVVNGAVSRLETRWKKRTTTLMRAVVITGAGDKSLCAGADLKADRTPENSVPPASRRVGHRRLQATGFIDKRPAPRSVARP